VKQKVKSKILLREKVQNVSWQLTSIQCSC